jgi:phage baseplate assembly protein W
MSEVTVDVPTSFGTRTREAVTDALRYWEPRRIVFNAVFGPTL